jgi:hypothetical protein
MTATASARPAAPCGTEPKGKRKMAALTFRSRGDLLSLVDRACERADEIESPSDLVSRGRILHADAIALLDAVCWSIVGISLVTLVARHQRKLADGAAAAARLKARKHLAVSGGAAVGTEIEEHVNVDTEGVDTEHVDIEIEHADAG